MNEISFNNIEERFNSLLPIIGIILTLSLLSFIFGYFVGRQSGYYKGKNDVYEKIIYIKGARNEKNFK